MDPEFKGGNIVEIVHYKKGGLLSQCRLAAVPTPTFYPVIN